MEDPKVPALKSVPPVAVAEVPSELLELDRELKESEENSEKKFLSPEEIFAATDITYHDVFVEPWKGWVKMKVMSGEDMAKLAELNKDERYRRHGDILLIMMCLVHPETKRQLMSFAQLEQLKKKSIHAFQILQDGAMKINRLGKYGKNDWSGIQI